MIHRPLRVRRPTSEDLRAVVEIVHEAYEPYVARIGGRLAPLDADYAASVDAEEVWVAVKDLVVGVIVLRPQRTALFLEHVAVDPNEQGRGIGRALIAFAERHAAELGLEEVTLYTNARMTENLRLYPSLDYAETERRRDDGFDCVFFSKRVSMRT